MADPQFLAENDRGTVCVEGNELCVDSTIPDAAKVRIGSPAVPGQSGGGGTLSIDIPLAELNDQGRPKRRALMELSAGRGSLGNEMKLSLQHGTETTDAAMHPLMQYNEQQGVIEFLKPVKFVTGSPIDPITPLPPTTPHELWSHDRAYYVVEQGREIGRASCRERV